MWRSVVIGSSGDSSLHWGWSHSEVRGPVWAGGESGACNL